MSRTLRQGHRGPDVLRWQTFLRDNGFDPGTLDGVFGERTAAATRAFQAARGLTADGIVGPRTLAKAASLGLRALRRLQNSEVTPELTAQARRILAAHHHEPYGSEFPFEIAGIRYVGRIEEHYHPPGGSLKPWGYHPGVSLFVDTEFDRQIDVPDDATGRTEETVTSPDEAPVVASRGVIVLDPGHGGSTMIGSSSPNNAKSPSGVLEKHLTLQLAELVRAALVERAVDVQVELTRTTDVNLSLSERAQRAREFRADAFLSLHFNGFDGNARGVEAWVRPKSAGNVNLEDDRRFAQRLTSAVFETLRTFDSATKNRGVKESAFGVLRDDLLGNTPERHPCLAALLEVEFLDVPQVDQLFNTGPQAELVRTRVAQAIAHALLETITPSVAPGGSEPVA